MHQSKVLLRKKNLLIGFDAFGTLFAPKAPIASQYGEIARRHGIGFPDEYQLNQAFVKAFKYESTENPNYGKGKAGFGVEKWWGNVISRTFQPFLQRDQRVSRRLIFDLINRFSTSEGYRIYPDVLPFFQMLRSRKAGFKTEHWRWGHTVVGVVTNSDDRVPEVLESFGLKIGPRRVGSVLQRQLDANVRDDVSFVVLSYDVGYEKPDERMFKAATQMLKETLGNDAGRKPTLEDDFELLFVGDTVEQDYLGAKHAGWNALLLDREDVHRTLLPDETSIARAGITVAGKDGRMVTEQVDVIRDLQALTEWHQDEEAFMKTSV
ncbi:hypothetical protein P154DRAFT_182468 [Amniculicola lignicola CBS 123094]|uniref:HAD-like protein n=1 Tax=Amniculicola lignicola CBS 123094 TaxID=1392246 RepID=A0A6A5WZB9_9PLEO|nr:hypothetical protein P154DRAFT_182468 [Amniculicola lignicola CBS 123094]